MPPRHSHPPASTKASDLLPGGGSAVQNNEQERRPVRKGTRSCWECKRRKVRCRFDLAISRDACRSCHRRGAACIGQEFSEETSCRRQPRADRDTRGRLQRLEALLGPILDGEDALGDATEERQVAAAPGELTYRSLPHNGPNIAEPPAGPAQLHCRGDQRLSSISQKLAAKLPSKQDCVTIFRVGGVATYCYQQMIAGSFDGPWKTPAPDFSITQTTYLEQTTHPALLARVMLGMAVTLQRIRPPAGSMSEDAGALQQRLAEAAISLVCNDDRLIGTVEALECLVFQIAYLANSGDLRLSLLACRRAITISQLMGLHQPHSTIHLERVDTNREVDPRCIWFGIVYAERLFCLLLGVPDTVRDTNDSGGGDFTSCAVGNTPLGRLQRTHSIVGSRIIQRNQCDPFSRRSRQLTHAIDLELAREASLMPPKWWAVPHLSSTSWDDVGSFQEINKLYHHLVHQFLLVQLHLPFMLRSRDPENLASKATCTNASRNALVRFVAAGNVRELTMMPEAIDLFALIAAVALLLAHIDAHRSENDDPINTSLRHQRPMDLALIQDTLDFMRSNSLRSSDILSRRGSDVLKRLLQIEENAAAGQQYMTSPGLSIGEDKDQNDDHRYFRLNIPYYGILVISPDRSRARSKRHLEPSSKAQSDPSLDQSGDSETLHQEETTTAAREAPFAEEGSPEFTAAPGLVEGQTWPPSISATLDDWAFQEVDAAFFDSIMSGFRSPSPGQTGR